MGRKAFKFTPEIIQQVERMAGVGLSIERMCGVIGIHETTFHKYSRKMPEINEAIERGKGKASFTVGKSLFNEAKSGNVAAIKWWEATRDDRSEKQRIEGDTSTTILVQTAVPEKLTVDKNDTD